MDSFIPPAYLIWFVIGLALALAELAVPGLILVFFGVGAWVVAILAVFMDLSLTAQVGIFLAASLLCLLLLRRYAQKVFKGEESDQNGAEGQEQDLGKLASVTKAIAPQKPGEIKYRGSFWTASGDREIAVGQTVVIQGRDPHDKMVFLVGLPAKTD